MTAIEPGQRIDDRYVVERMLARGGMATVWIVKHEKLHSLHAMKVLDISTSDIRRRLVQEGRLQASLRHPNIVAVTDTLEIDNQPALVMEYVDGPTLGKWLEDHDCPLDLVEKWFVQIVSAVAYAHARGLVHRDLKPDNILLAPMSGDLLPKVADFGIAKVLALAGAEGGRSRTVTGMALGTPSYMPPEQVASAAEVDHRADVFALGCILYEMVCGKQAFSGDSLLQVFARIAEGDYEPPEKTSPDLPKRVIATIKGCLEPDPARRIADCEALLAVFRGEKAAPKTAAKPKRTRSEDRPDDAPRGSRWGLWLAAAGLGFGGVASVTAVAAVAALVVVALAGMAGAYWVARSSAPGGVSLTLGGADTAADTDAAHVVAPVPLTVAPVPLSVTPVPGVRLPEAAPTPRLVPAGALTPLGQPATVLGWTVTVHGARTAAKVQESVFKHAAESGETLVLVDVSVRFDGAGEESPFFPSKVIGPWGDEYATTLACEMALPTPLDTSSTFTSGESRRGEACFHVPTAHRGLKFRFKPEMTRDDAVTVSLPL